MFGATFKLIDTSKRVTAAADKAAFKNFAHAAARISKDAKASIEKTDGPSLPGSPPHTHRGSFLRRGIRFAADKQGAVIGPMASVVGEAGSAHEFGGEFKGSDFPERPFMGPALEQNIDRFASTWQGSIGE